MQSVDAQPGINKGMLQALQTKARQQPALYGNVALMVDAMSIRRQIVYDAVTQQMTGFVDLGDGCNDEGEATEVLVFMLVGLTGHWKAQ